MHDKLTIFTVIILSRGMPIVSDPRRITLNALRQACALLQMGSDEEGCRTSPPPLPSYSDPMKPGPLHIQSGTTAAVYNNGGEADAVAAAVAAAAAAASADQEKWFWHADSKPILYWNLDIPKIAGRGWKLRSGSLNA
ncbi:hypothetical protein DBV15_03712 [Temnothorax longispinosus]|uniref:Uncharacterized protein n=1 Tax=Temnothorax longispinosus TaxID=300112 RepID=A0A4S2KEA3_9HYME|nr:hypothetical protein DBV15_03712 [Temnothorax longispinosus]